MLFRSTTLTGANTYGGNTTINAGTLVLSGSGTLGNNTSTLTISSATLDIQNGAKTIGALVMNGTSPAITNSTGTSSLIVSGTSTLAGSVTTSSTQLYTGNVTLGAATTLTGSTITTNGTIVGGTNSLTITGNAVFGDGTTDTVTGLTTLDRKSTRLNSSHIPLSRMPSSA